MSLGPDKLPLTVGGTVKTGPVPFADVTARTGLAGWKQVTGDSPKRFILDAIGSGVALLDYDNDGWLDIYLVNGSTEAALAGKAAAPSAALFHNNHDGTFTDVSAKAGVANSRWGVGAVVGDFDNDGWPDLYVTNFGKNRLYRNNHDGTFTDVAETAGVALGGWSTGATWGDYDGDGKLDLFVPGYVKFDVQNPPDLSPAAANLAFCSFPWRARVLRPARAARRGRPPVSQQRRRHLYRHQCQGGRRRQSRILRAGLCVSGRQQRRQARPAGGERLHAELPLPEQG